MKQFVLSLLVLSGPLFCNHSYADSFVLSSPQVAEGGILSQDQVLNGFGCSGKNISPELNWSGEPAKTKSFALTVYDPDAPTGSGWWHWVVFNVPVSSHSLALNSGSGTNDLLPQGSIQSRTDFGSAGYGGACPPEQDSAHHYEFTVWALDVATLPLDANASAAMVGFYLHQHELGHTVLTATYDR